MLEDVIDEAAALPLNMHHSIQAQAQAQTQAQTQSPTQTGHNTVQAAKVELEEYIIYSKIYGCPQFCFRAFDQTGAPLSNSQLLSLNFLKPDTNTTTTTTQSHYQSEDTPALGLLPDQGTSSPSPWPSAPSPPLLQSLELPSTGQLVLAINPTPILEGVNEIMQSGPRPQRQAHKDAHNHARGRNQHEDQSRSREGDEASQLESAVNWLECWLLLISNKVDLSYP
nr:uncharacterized protein I303_05896 [Kwoniella dejecticola CBS 10117]OBR83616.1 hypothetical protein I303_05896 [Kwoniella dejecticola CBS 10117]